MSVRDVGHEPVITEPAPASADVQPGANTELHQPAALPTHRLGRLDRLDRLSKLGGPFHPVLRFLALFVISLAFCGPFLKHQVDEHRALSPIDERTYVDVLYKVHSGQLLVRRGESMSAWTLREGVCRGVPPFEKANPQQCANGTFKDGEVNTADIDPPTYYQLTNVVASGILQLGVSHDLVTAGRYANAFWCAATMAALFLLSRYLGASRLSSGLAAFLVPTGTYLLDQFRFITPHASDLLVGVVVTWLVIAWDRRQLGIWALPVAGALSVGLKASNIVIAMAMVLYLLLRMAWSLSSEDGNEKRSAKWRPVVGAAVLTASVGALSALWLGIIDAAAVGRPHVYASFDSHGLKLKYFTDTFGAFLRPIGLSTLQGASLLISGFLVAAAFHYAVADRADGMVLRRLGITYVVAAALTPVALTLITIASTHQYVPPPGRYGLSLVPMSLALGAVWLGRSRVAIGVATVLVAVSTIALHLGGTWPV